MKTDWPLKYSLMINTLITIFTFLTCSSLNNKNKIRIQQGEKPILIWLEAEKGQIKAPMAIGKDKSTWNGQYVHQPAEKDRGTRLKGKKGSIYLSFEVPFEGLYTLWARVFYIDIDGNSFYCRMDNQNQSILGNNYYPLRQWHWTRGNTWYLKEGQHTLHIATRENGACLDRLLLTTISYYFVSSKEPELDKTGYKSCKIRFKRGIIVQGDTLEFTVVPPLYLNNDKNTASLKLKLLNEKGQILSEASGNINREYYIVTEKLNAGDYTLEAVLSNQERERVSKTSSIFWVLPNLTM